MSSTRKTVINVLLLALVVLDLVLAVVAIAFPEIWLQVFHGTGVANADAVALLKRTGAIWAAFTLFQLIALVRWRARLYWLPLVAGVRLTEVFSDWAYLLATQSQITWVGWIGLLIAPPSNWLLGWFFISSYLKEIRNGNT